MKTLFETLKPMTEEAEPTAEEKEQFFIDRINKHKDLVAGAIEKILNSNLVNEYPELSGLTDRANIHDDSKFEEPEKTPYIKLTWNKKEGINEPDEAITQATLHHIKNNPHHPEYHLEDKSKANLSNTNRDDSIEVIDASNMPAIDIAEMLCDWQAMSEELGTNTAREWYDKVKDVRWHFSEEQDALIDKLLKVFE